MSLDEFFKGLGDTEWVSIDPEDIEFGIDDEAWGVERLTLYLSGSKAERERQANVLKDALLSIARTHVPIA